VDSKGAAGRSGSGPMPGGRTASRDERGRGLHGARAPGPAYTGPLAAGWQGVTATAIDATTVQFDLAVPLGGFLQAAAQPLLPAHLLAGVSSPTLPTRLLHAAVGDGPFALTDLTAQAAELVPVLGALNAGSGPLATLGAAPPHPASRFWRGWSCGSTRARRGDCGLPAGEVDAVSGLSPAAAAPSRPRPRRVSSVPRHDAHRHLLNLRPGAGRSATRGFGRRSSLRSTGAA